MPQPQTVSSIQQPEYEPGQDPGTGPDLDPGSVPEEMPQQGPDVTDPAPDVGRPYDTGDDGVMPGFVIPNPD